jgi:5'-nucleotidase
MKKPEVYLDMDGVIADFFAEYAKLAGVSTGSYRDIPPAKVDPTLNKMVGTDFFYRLPKFASADALVDMIVKAFGGYHICSSPLRGDYEGSEKYKTLWIKKNLKQQPKSILITPNKAKYATQPDGTPNILIDDRGSNITAWEAKGGVGIKYQADENGLDVVLAGFKRAINIIKGEETHEPQKLQSLDRGKMIAVQKSGDSDDEESTPKNPVGESYPKHQDLSGVSTERLKAYLAKQSQQQASGEGNQVKRVRAELERRSQSVQEGKEDKIAQLKKDYATAVHWSKNEKSPQERESARQKAEKIKRHLETQYKQGVAEGGSNFIKEAPIEMDPSDPMNPMIVGTGSNPAKLKYRMARAAGQLKDLASRVDNAGPAEWQTMARQFEELKMNISEIKHALEELAKRRSKGGVSSRGIDPNITAR